MVQAPDGWMLIGRVAGPFGVRGEIKVELRTDFPERFKRLSCVYLGEERTPFEVERSRSHHDRILLKLREVNSPERVDALRGAEIFIPRAEAMPLPDGAYYLDDLLGMVVETVDGDMVGTVSDVLRTGANDVYVVDARSASILIPAIQDAIHLLDINSRRMVVERWVLEPDE